MVELVKSGRTPSELACEYEPSEGSIRNWVAQSERDAGQRSDGLSTDEMVELRRPAAREQAAAHGARHPKTSGGLVRTGERRDPEEGFGFAIDPDPLPPGQVWGIGPGGPETGPSLYRLEVTVGRVMASEY